MESGGRIVSCGNRTTHIAEEMIAEFWNRMAILSDDDCWLWKWGVSGAGYGQMRINGTMWFSHRLAYALVNGPIPAGLLVCHQCDAHYAPGDTTYRRCSNPRHLFLGTKKDNAVDCVNKGRKALGEFHRSAKLNWVLVRQIRAMPHLGNRQIIDLAKELGIAANSLRDVLHYKTWKEEPLPLTTRVSA